MIDIDTTTTTTMSSNTKASLVVEWEGTTTKIQHDDESTPLLLFSNKNDSSMVATMTPVVVVKGNDLLLHKKQSPPSIPSSPLNRRSSSMSSSISSSSSSSTSLELENQRLRAEIQHWRAKMMALEQQQQQQQRQKSVMETQCASRAAAGNSKNNQRGRSLSCSESSPADPFNILEREDVSATAMYAMTRTTTTTNGEALPLLRMPNYSSMVNNDGFDKDIMIAGGSDGVWRYHEKAAAANDSDDVEAPERKECDHDFDRMANDADIQQTFSFSSVLDRASWLVGLLVFQSLSSFIIQRNEAVLYDHAVIIQFLTMLVGAGGNAGNQASVKVIRGLALGTIHSDNYKRFLREELKVGLTLSAILGLAGCLRAAVFMVPHKETIAITTSLFTIVWTSTILGSLLPLAMKCIHIDPAHSSTTIQVVMDILGVTITVHLCAFMLGGSSSFD